MGPVIFTVWGDSVTRSVISPQEKAMGRKKDMDMTVEG